MKTRRVTIQLSERQWEWLRDELDRRYGQDAARTIKDLIPQIINDAMHDRACRRQDDEAST